MKFEYIGNQLYLDGIKIKGVTDFSLNVNTNGEHPNTLTIDMFVEVGNLKDIEIKKQKEKLKEESIPPVE